MSPRRPLVLDRWWLLPKVTGCFLLSPPHPWAPARASRIRKARGPRDLRTERGRWLPATAKGHCRAREGAGPRAWEAGDCVKLAVVGGTCPTVTQAQHPPPGCYPLNSDSASLASPPAATCAGGPQGPEQEGEEEGAWRGQHLCLPCGQGQLHSLKWQELREKNLQGNTSSGGEWAPLGTPCMILFIGFYISFVCFYV